MIRYPVMNLRPRLGGLLEDYNNEINHLKDKLYHGQAFSGYNPPPMQYPPSNPPANPPPPPGPATQGGATYFGPRPGPMVATGSPKPPNPNDITVVKPPTPPPTPGLPQYPQYPSVVTGAPGADYQYPPIINFYPPVPTTPQPCPPGYTSTPSGCLKNTPTLPDRPPIQPPPPVETPATSVTQNSGNGPYQATSGEGPGQCPEGQFWDGVKCRGSVSSLPSIPTGGGSAPTETSFGPGAASGPYGLLSGTRIGFLGQVRLRR